MSSDNEIIIHCIMNDVDYKSFSDMFDSFQNILKAKLKLQITSSDKLKELITEPTSIVITDIHDKTISNDNYLIRKKASIFQFTEKIDKNLGFFSYSLIDGTILRGNDTSMNYFLERINTQTFRDHEDCYKENIEKWVSSNEYQSTDHNMLCLFGPQAELYSELKKTIFYHDLKTSFSVNAKLNKHYDDIRSNISEEKNDSLSIETEISKICDSINKFQDRPQRVFSILLTGETGTGKTFLAENLKNCLLNTKGSVPKLNCSLFDKNFIRWELFGARAGTYTGQNGGNPGFLLNNAMGVVILDEIGDFDIELQASLLSYLDDSCVRIINLNTPIFCPVILIGTTNKNIKELITGKQFRHDLYERFDLHLHVPALRERKDDIKPFLKYILRKQLQQVNIESIKQNIEVSRAFINEITSRDYSHGNYRELEHTVIQAFKNCILSGDTLLLRKHLQ